MIAERGKKIRKEENLTCKFDPVINSFNSFITYTVIKAKRLVQSKL